MTKPTKNAEKPKSKQSPKGPRELIVAQNRSASYNYHILEKLEAGLVLHGTEVKALREGKANIRDAYVDFKPSGPFLVNAHIAQYMPGGPWNHEPLGERKLLPKPPKRDAVPEVTKPNVSGSTSSNGRNNKDHSGKKSAKRAKQSRK